MTLPDTCLSPLRFPEPLKSFVIFIGEIYDEEKNRAAREKDRVIYLTKPSSGWWSLVCTRVGDVISADGVHPNDTGYEVYGEKLGVDVAKGILDAPPMSPR